MDAPIPEVIDAYARPLAMANAAVLQELIGALQDKGVLTKAEVITLLADALTAFNHPQPTNMQIAAQGVIQSQIEAARGAEAID